MAVNFLIGHKVGVGFIPSSDIKIPTEADCVKLGDAFWAKFTSSLAYIIAPSAQRTAIYRHVAIAVNLFIGHKFSAVFIPGSNKRIPTAPISSQLPLPHELPSPHPLPPALPP